MTGDLMTVKEAKTLPQMAMLDNTQHSGLPDRTIGEGISRGRIPLDTRMKEEIHQSMAVSDSNNFTGRIGDRAL